MTKETLADNKPYTETGKAPPQEGIALWDVHASAPVGPPLWLGYLYEPSSAIDYLPSPGDVANMPSLLLLSPGIEKIES